MITSCVSMLRRRAVKSAPISEPIAVTEKKMRERADAAVERLGDEQREHDLEVERERADDRHHHERDPEVGHGAHVAQPGADLRLRPLGDRRHAAAPPCSS